MTHTALLKRFNELEAVNQQTVFPDKLRSEYNAFVNLLASELNSFHLALAKSNSVMLAAESLIGSLGLHDSWHKTGKHHGAFHDLLFQRSRNQELLANNTLANAQAADIAELVACLREAEQYFGDREGISVRVSALLERIGP